MVNKTLKQLLLETCSRCGKNLVVAKRWIDPYDANGVSHPLEWLILTCPSKRWYNHHTRMTYLGWDDIWNKKMRG